MLDRDDSIDFIERLFGEGELSNGGLNISVICPFCQKEKDEDYSKRKLVIRTDDHRVHCWVCGYRSKNLIHLTRSKVKIYGPGIVKEYADKFLTKLGGNGGLRCILINASAAGIELFEDYLEDVETTVDVPPKLPENFVFLAEAIQDGIKDRYIQKHIDYLKKERGIDSIDDFWYWKFCVAPPTDKEFGWRVIIPSFDAEGHLNYFSGRSIRDNSMFRYWNCDVSKKNRVFNECMIDWKKPLLLVEGPFDLIKTRMATSNAVPILGKILTDQYLLAQKIIQNKTPIIIALDPEESKYQSQMAEYFSGYGNEVSILEYPEWVEDLGSISEKQVKELYENNVRSYDSLTELRKRIERI